MRFNHLLLFVGIMLVFGSTAMAQSFEKGNKIIYSGIKISIYSVKIPSEDNVDEGDGAASWTIPIGFEYAFTDRIGAGMEIGLCNYFTDEDTITGAIADAHSFDALLTGNFHWVKAEHIDLYSGLGLGLSNFKYESHDSEESHYTATGFYFDLNLFNARFYIGKSFALSLHFGMPFINFGSGRIQDNLGNDYEFPLSFKGVDLGTGLAFRF